jgi:uncharacterized protein related to proFAR isomerase
MLITQTLIVRDADLNIIDTIKIDPGQEITHADVRAIVRAHRNAEVIERVETIERRPS